MYTHQEKKTAAISETEGKHAFYGVMVQNIDSVAIHRAMNDAVVPSSPHQRKKKNTGRRLQLT